MTMEEYCERFFIKPRGLIHVGAHEGNEIEMYQRIGCEKVIFIEANPHVFKRLVGRTAGIPGVIVINCVIAARNGVEQFYITNFDQSSSILRLKEHKKYYPGIVETTATQLPCRNLDTLIAEIGEDYRQFNILSIDIQGAELLALGGARQLLSGLKMIYTEVNIEELYEGCALLNEVDGFLGAQGFARMNLELNDTRSWGDAAYLRIPRITMSTLGINGRFGNQLFQYFFLRIYAERHKLRLEIPDWLGRKLFGLQEFPILENLPRMSDSSNRIDEAKLLNSNVAFEDIDLWGFFQYHTSIYVSYRGLFRSLFQPVPEIENLMHGAVNRLRDNDGTLVCLHLRRGDYGYAHFFVAPTQWYLDWLENLWPRLRRPLLYIASDEPGKVIADFAKYHPIISKDLDANIGDMDFYLDFYIMQHCDILAISNSSFSFAASMLNDRAKMFVRPTLRESCLIEFDPWNSEVLLSDILDR